MTNEPSAIAAGIDLDAARREVQYPHGIRITQRGESFVLPAELPIDAFDSILSEDLDLAGMVRIAWANDDLTEGIIQALFADGTPQRVIGALRGVLQALFGADDYTRFQATRPSFADLVRLTSALVRIYGSGLGEALGSAGLSGVIGPRSSTTSSDSTESTPEASGAAPTPEPEPSPVPASSEPAVSATT